MAYQIPITIEDAITAIQKRKYVLPSIQREFVWRADQIEMLFDSVMRDYPISTFLFWNVQKDRVDDFQFYEFLKDYHMILVILKAHVKTVIQKRKLKAAGISEEEIDNYLNSYNTLANLKLIEAVENIEKNATLLKEWLNKTLPSKEGLNNYKIQHFIPINVELDLNHFPGFIDERKKLIKSKFQSILRVEKHIPSDQVVVN